jgi:hypothetical protein
MHPMALAPKHCSGLIWLHMVAGDALVAEAHPGTDAPSGSQGKGGVGDQNRKLARTVGEENSTGQNQGSTKMDPPPKTHLFPHDPYLYLCQLSLSYCS